MAVETGTSGHSTQSYQVTQVHPSPSIWAIQNFMSDEECDHLIQLGEDKLAPSLTIDPETGNHIQVEDRTSTLTFLSLNQDPIVTQIEFRIANLVRMPVNHGEGLQILRYEIGQEYKPHYDYFDPALSGSHKALAKGGQRVATILMYLSDVEEGGETVFPKIDLKVPPKKGHAILFYSLYSNGELDPNSLHGSIPVVKGTKWVATKWLREKPFIA